MKHNVDMLAKGKGTWKDRVRLIGLSVDQDGEKLKAHIITKGFQNHVEHYHAANGTCTINAQLGAGGIPHVALLNPKGQIVFKGHPSSINLEQAIDDLLEKGESNLCPLEKKEGGAAPEKTKLSKPVSGEKGIEIVADFKKVQKELLADCKDGCEDMQRAFFVLEEEFALNE